MRFLLYWFTERRFNAFDIGISVASVPVISAHGFLAGAGFIFLGATVSVLLEHLNDQVRRK